MTESDKIEACAHLLLRQVTDPFSSKEFAHQMQLMGIKVSQKQAKEILQSHPLAYSISETQFLSRAGFFTGALFSIKPTQFEIDNNILIMGSRSIPFMDPEALPHELTIVFDGAIVNTVVKELPTYEILKHYTLFGSEYASQIVALDPANKGVDFSSCDFELPPRVKLTCFDMEKLYKENGFVHGDRLLLQIQNWDESILEMIPLCERKPNPFVQTKAEIERAQWYEELETSFTDTFEFIGAASNIDEQLMYTFMTNLLRLSISNCGSLEEFLEESDRIGIVEFGVETRIWKKNEDIPLVPGLELNDPESCPEHIDGSVFSTLGQEFSPQVFKCMVLDEIAQGHEDFEHLFENRFKEIFEITTDISKLMRVPDDIIEQFRKIKENYNKFADYEIAPIRHKALELYVEIVRLMWDLRIYGITTKNMPQSELIILVQLFTHLLRMMEMLENEDLPNHDIESIKLSIEGMFYSYEEIRVPIADAIEKAKKGRFNIV